MNIKLNEFLNILDENSDEKNKKRIKEIIDFVANNVKKSESGNSDDWDDWDFTDIGIKREGTKEWKIYIDIENMFAKPYIMDYAETSAEKKKFFEFVEKIRERAYKKYMVN